MNQLAVITRKDLSLFGCPHCSSKRGSKLISILDFYIWTCDDCEEESGIVKSKFIEIFSIELKNTDVMDFIDKHPFRDTFEHFPVWGLPQTQSILIELN